MTSLLMDEHLRYNWFDFAEFYNFISEKNYKVLIELGVWKGHSISYLAEKNKNSEIYAVDLWDEGPEKHDLDNVVDGHKYKHLNNDYKNLKRIYNEYLEFNNTRHLINDIQGDAIQASILFGDEEVDFAFLDLWNEEDIPTKALTAWYPKIKKGGILAGHDYGVESVYKGVKKFVKETGHDVKTVKGSQGIYVWWIEK